jgi:hypothetical protein
MLGGTSGARTLKIPGMPTFNVGDREIVFIAGNGQSFCPLVRIGHGRYHVRTDAATGREYITRDNHAPLTTLDDVVLPLEIPVVATRLGAVTAALSPAAFETSIASAVAQQELAHSNR